MGPIKPKESCSGGMRMVFRQSSVCWVAYLKKETNIFMFVSIRFDSLLMTTPVGNGEQKVCKYTT